MRKRTYWREDWAIRVSGGHRYGSENFLRKEAAEKLFHLGHGRRLLDFGCGSAELLVYYAKCFDSVIGADFSPRMLAAARERIALGGGGNVAFIEADDVSVWDAVTGDFDVITAGQVVQFLDREQFDHFVGHAAERLAANGTIVLFDIIHPILYRLFYLGIFGRHRTVVHALGAALLTIGKRTVRRLRGLPPDVMGNAFAPDHVRVVAAKYGFETEIVWSMYYEYRYHAILTRASDAQQ